MKRSIYVVLILLSTVLGSCRLVFKKPEVVRVREVSVTSFAVDRSEISISLLIHNPNSYNIKLSKLDLDILNMDRQNIGKGKLSRDYTLGKKRTDRIDFDVVLQTRAAIGLINNSNHKIDVFITAKGEGRAMGLKKKFIFEEPYSFSFKEEIMQEIPRFKADGQPLFKLLRTYVHQYQLGTTVLRGDFLLLNPYGLAFRFKDFPADIFINDKKVGSGDLLKELSFKEDVHYQEGIMEFELSNPRSVLSAARGILKGGIDYRVSGNVVLEILGMEIVAPYSYRGRIPLNIWETIIAPGSKSS